MDDITEAQEYAAQVSDSLRCALTEADPMTGIILLGLIEPAVTLERGIRMLLEAMKEAEHG